MLTFIAHVEFRMDAERLEDGGRRFRELAEVAKGVGFELIRSRVEPAPAEDDHPSQWTRYGPTT